MISVCLATCNGDLYIKDQLLSVLSQLSNDDEVIVVDDDSNDRTIEIIKSFSDNRVKLNLSKNHKKLGIVKNFERALLQAKGDFIFLCDQDDVWLPEKVEVSLAALKSSLLVVSDCEVVDSKLNKIQSSFFNLRNSKSGIFHNILKNSYLGCCMAFRKELLPYALPIPKLSPMHDMWIGLVAETRGKVTFIQKPLILYRRHNNNASPTSGKSNFNFLKKIKIRVLLSYFLLIRTLRNLFVI
jgi:glycosyltransferase involved in cell wall biosynthesis